MDSTGHVTVIAGAGTTLPPYAACTPAASANLATAVQSVAVSSSGLVYEAGGAVVNVLDPVAGTIQTIAGQWLSGNPAVGCQDALVATQGTLGEANFGIAVAPDGSVYVTDETCDTLRRIGTDGSLSTVTHPWLTGCTGNNGPWTAGELASTACLSNPTGVAVAPDGTIYVADNRAFSRVSRIDARTGVITTYAGSLPAGRPVLSPAQYDGQLATSIQFSGDPQGLAVRPDGTVYVTDRGAKALYGIDVTGIIHLVAGGAPSTVTQEVDNGPAIGSLLYFPDAVAVDPNGSILVHDYGTGSALSRVRIIAPSYPTTFVPGTTSLASADGSEVYEFQTYGQHVATSDPVTGATLRTFQYDPQNRLIGITETRGGTTTLAYNGTTVTITPPFSAGGQQTTLTLDETGGHAITVRLPAGETTAATYTNGLMASLIDPRSGVHSYLYDALGRLTQDTDPANATIGLVTTVDTTPLPAAGGVEPLASWSIAVTSAAGHVTTHQDFSLSNGSSERNTIAPSGATSLSTESNGGLWTFVAPDGTTSSIQQVADPQFGMVDPYDGSTTRTTPSGLTYATARTRTIAGSPLAPSQILDLTTINGQSAPWSSTYTGSTRQWLYDSPAGRQGIQQLDALGRVSSISYPGTKTLPTTAFTYDADGRIQTVTVTPNANGGGAPRVTTNTYDTYLAGYLAATQDPAGDVTTYDQRDPDGRVLDLQLPDFATQPLSRVATTYDLNGNVASITVPPATSLPSTHTFTSTPVDLPASYTPPQVSTATTGNDPELATLTTSYAYDPDRQLTTVDAPEGASYAAIMKAYDTFGRLSATYDPLSNVTATYAYALNAGGVSTDQIANVTTSDGVSLTNTFDGFLKRQTLWTSTSVTGSVNWTYDSFFRPATLQVSHAPAITFAYDLDSLYAGTTSPAFTVTRDQSGASLDGLPYASTLGTVSDAWTYDGFGAQSSYTVKTSDGTVLYAMYGTGGVGSPISRDNLGRITEMNETINGATHSWLMTYDVRGRLESVTLDGTTSVYGYDPNGNMTTVDGSTFGTYDAQDRLVTLSPTSGSGPWTYSYTNNGDLTGKTNGIAGLRVRLRPLVERPQRPGQRVDRRRASPTSSMARTAASGRPLRRRWARRSRMACSTTSKGGLSPSWMDRATCSRPSSTGSSPTCPTTWCAAGVLTASSATGGGRAARAQHDRDRLSGGRAAGGLRRLGNVTKIVDPACSVGGAALCFQPFGFAGGLWEPSTGVVRFGARDYDPMAGRWTQKDASRFGGGRNFYKYAKDDPINYIDRTGRNPGLAIPFFGAGSGGLGVGAAATAAGAFAAAGASLGLAAYEAQQLWNETHTPTSYAPDTGPNSCQASQPKPNGLPTGTLPIDQYPGIDPHGIKDGYGLGPTDWVGIAPDGGVWVDDGTGNGIEIGNIDSED